jgi:putative cell wall-binding protein
MLPRKRKAAVAAWGVAKLPSRSSHSKPVSGKSARRQKAPRRKSSATARAGSDRYWSGDVTKHSDALDLEPGIFTSADPAEIARSLKHSADVSTRRKGSAYQSAMSMLNFYINRAGKNLSDAQRQILEQSKQETRKLFGRE